MKRIIIDDGTREYEICNRFGKVICVLHFRPSDISIAERYREMRETFGDIVKPLAELDIQADGTAADDAAMDALHEADVALRKALARLLDSDDAADIFAARNPFSSVGGKFFCEIVLDAIGGIVEDVMTEETEASRKRTSKYIEEDSDARAAAADA